MNPAFGIPPKSKAHLTPPQDIAKRLQVLIGETFPLTGKMRTDGSNMRKLVAATLESFPLPEPGDAYFVLP